MNRTITEDLINATFKQRFVRYDKHGEEHYSLASALQKSIVRFIHPSIYPSIHPSIHPFIHLHNLIGREVVMCKQQFTGWEE